MTTSTPSGVIDTAAFSCDGPPPASGRDWYLHSETSSIGGASYFRLKDQAPADGAALTISSVFSPGLTGQVRPTSNSGKFTLPLSGVIQLTESLWEVTYRVKRNKADGGFVWFTNAVDIEVDTGSTWMDLDLSPYIPAEAKGVMVRVLNVSGDDLHGLVRGKEDTRDYMSDPSFEAIQANGQRWQIVKADADRRIQAWNDDADVHFQILGYTIGSDPSYFTIPIEISPPITGTGPPNTGIWTTVDVAALVDADADGVILFIDSTDAFQRDFGIREVGSSFTIASGENLMDAYSNTMYLVGLNAGKHFELYLENSNFKIYLVGQTKGSVVYYTLDISVANPPLSSWQELDADDYGILPRANGLIFHVATQGPNKLLSFRHGDSTDTWNGVSGGNRYQLQAAAGLTVSGNVWDQYQEADGAGVAIAAYTRLVQMDVNAGIDVLVRKADGTIRSTIAIDVANTGNINDVAWQSIKASYAFPGYTVVDQSDYLEIDLSAEATANSSGEDVSVDFRVDEPDLPPDQQSRIRGAS